VFEHSHLAIDVDLIDKVDEEVSTPFGELKKSDLEDDVKFLKPKTDKADKEFLNQIAYLQSLIKLVSDIINTHVTFNYSLLNQLQINEEKEKPTALNVRVSLRMLKNSDGGSSEAHKLLTATIEKLSAAVTKAFDGNAVVAVITVGEHHTRSKRQTEPETPKANEYNLAELTSKNYPVVFNIIFWFSIIFIFSLLAISLALSNVEDKDSIIYRMTGARGKKDN
jgi:renin receptor